MTTTHQPRFENKEEYAMPQSEHAQPVEGERKEDQDNNRSSTRDAEQRQARDASRPEDVRDYWRSGQIEDESADDEGIDDVRMSDANGDDGVYVEEDPTLPDQLND